MLNFNIHHDLIYSFYEFVQFYIFQNISFSNAMPNYVNFYEQFHKFWNLLDNDNDNEYGLLKIYKLITVMKRIM